MGNGGSEGWQGPGGQARQSLNSEQLWVVQAPPGEHKGTAGDGGEDQVANGLVQEKCYWGPGRGLGKQDSRCIHRKPETKLENSLHAIKRLASAAERMVLPSLQAAQVAEAGLRLHGQPPSCRRLGPMRGVQRRQPLPSRMTSKCANLMLLSTTWATPRAADGDAEVQGGHIWVLKETQRRRGTSQSSIGKNGEFSPCKEQPRHGLACGSNSVVGSWGWGWGLTTGA